ncbi:MAG: hypothetical protein GF311_26615 [Candidatus Lokiarchaeota archaeon]|nr:hypothetical protein [Candidatus Lokiarchaeota archaeon]
MSKKRKKEVDDQNLTSARPGILSNSKSSNNIKVRIAKKSDLQRVDRVFKGWKGTRLLILTILIGTVFIVYLAIFWKGGYLS